VPINIPTNIFFGYIIKIIIIYFYLKIEYYLNISHNKIKMYYLSKSPIVPIDHIGPINNNENIENMVHAIPIYDESNVIIMVPNLLITQDTRNIPYKYKIVSTSIILCCFSIIIITIAVSSINNNRYQPIPNNSLGNYSNIKF